MQMNPLMKSMETQMNNWVKQWNLGSQTRPLEVSLTNRVYDMEERISDVENKAEEMDSTVK